MPDQGDWRRAALVRLERDGLVAERAGAARTTRSWQGAMARAALVLFQRQESWRDLRLPIALALHERYAGLPDHELADLIEVMLPIEAAELTAGRGEEDQSC
jgi:hypothetical protein